MLILNISHVKYDFFTIFPSIKLLKQISSKISSKIRFGVFSQNLAKNLYIGRKNFILVYLYFSANCIILNVIEFYKFPLQ